MEELLVWQLNRFFALKGKSSLIGKCHFSTLDSSVVIVVHTRVASTLLLLWIVARRPALTTIGGEQKKAVRRWSFATRKYLPFCITCMPCRAQCSNREMDNLQIAQKNLKIAPSDNNINYFLLSLLLSLPANKLCQVILSLPRPPPSFRLQLLLLLLLHNNIFFWSASPLSLTTLALKRLWSAPN